MPEVVPADGFAQMKAWMRSIEQRLDKIETARRLENASLSGGAFSVLDPATLAEQVRLGLQDDGTYGLNVVGGRLTVEGATVDANSAGIAFGSALNVSLTTSEAVHCSATLVGVPAWATRALVVAFGGVQMTNASGGNQSILYRVDIDGSPGSGAATHTVPAGITNAVMTQAGRILTSPGDSIEITLSVAVDTGSNNGNVLSLNAVAIYLRV